MNIYMFAMQMEKDGEQYYWQLAERSRSAGLKRIFGMLADEEVRHYRVVESLARKATPQLAETKVLENVRNIFIGMRESREELHIDTTEEVQSYRKACDLEEQSRGFYQEKAGEAGEGPVRDILLQLAGEEGKHLLIIENIIEFVAKPEPGRWLENAEWYHLDEY